MTTAREIMTADPTCARTSDTILDAARSMADRGIGALPVCGEDDKLKGMITDRDIVVKVIAAGKDPRSLHAGELAQGEVITVDAGDDVASVLGVMERHQVRRLPVLDGTNLIGMVAQADVARALDQPKVGELLQALSIP
ncbi:CBS domain protein [Herbihabitans rhizosphaerae]|uniref:CBS domain protein n=1 Tax=Herbihabitans rhizosphaerae TaxID=1872711 RepID=A0A4Q7KJG7_9PSEU|nr:CBS domain-containing protein [Herbihabitans rhizosphaerae]RZS36565.1 CBS domain protein [Herbihabitans rhizosphaerae]